MARLLKVQLLVPVHGDAMQAALEGLVALDAVQIAHGQLPPLYRTRVVYKRERPGGDGGTARERAEQWQTAMQVLNAQHGDCEDLAAYRAAELRVYHHEPARAVVRRTGPKTWHAVVLRADGTIEDPSGVLKELEKRWQRRSRRT